MQKQAGQIDSFSSHLAITSTTAASSSEWPLREVHTGSATGQHSSTPGNASTQT